MNDIERKRVENAVAKFVAKRRPPVHLRDKVDLAFHFDGRSVEIFEIRPAWQHRKETMEHPVAKATFVRSKNRWRIFWMRRDLKWHGYEPNLEVQSLKAFLNVVDRDEYCCFFG